MKVKLTLDGGTLATREWDGQTNDDLLAMLEELLEIKDKWVASGHFPAAVRWGLDGLTPDRVAAARMGSGRRPRPTTEDGTTDPNRPS